MKIEHASIIVTGANRGIGRALVERFVAHGASRIYALARTAQDLAGVVALDPSRIRAVQADVTNPSDLAHAASAAKDVTLVVNNAGVLDFGTVLEAEPATFRRNFDVNFYGVLNTAKAFAPALTANQGALINVLTVVALASMPGLGVYNASKAAAWSLTQSLRADLSKRGVRVFSVFPGPVDTDMLRGVDMPKTAPVDVANAIIAGIQAEQEDIFPDPMSQQIYSAWAADHKAVERKFATM
jgi:NAD(P)-dependent dehydrogenase (short-subunit alcohol dehydrogenase family)